MKVLNYIVLYGDKILKVLGNIILAAILLVISAGIVSRYVFGSPFSWTEELTTFLMVNLGYISGAIVTIAKKHVVADYFIAKAPPTFQRIVSFVSRIVAIAVLLLICVSSYQQLLSRVAYRSAALGIPRTLFYVPLFSMSLFMVFAVVVDILNDIFPGYNIQDMAAKKEAELARREELLQTEESQEKMDAFLKSSGAEHSK